MSLPTFITVTIPEWATGGNYPAGSDPWSGTAMRQTPSQLYWTPKTSDPAQFMNYQLGLTADQLGNVNTNLNSLNSYFTALQNYNLPCRSSYLIFPQMSSSTSAGLGFLGWDSFNKRWLVWGNVDVSAHSEALYSSPTGSVWTLINTPTSFEEITILTGTFDSSTGNAVFSGQAGASPGNNLRWISISSGSLAKHSFATTNFIQVSSISFFNSKWFFFAYDSTASAMKWYSSTSPTAVPTDISASIPATMAVPDFSLLARAIDTAHSNSIMLVTCLDSAGTHPNNYASTPDGTTWTLRTLSLTSGYYMTCLHWDSVGSLFVLGTYNGTNSQVYTSSDGLSWTLKSTVNGQKIVSINNNGATYLALFYSGIYGVSIDQGVTWNRGAAELGMPSAFTNRIVVSDTQVALIDQINVSMSLMFGNGPAL